MADRLQSAEQLIQQLTPDELSKFATWFADFQDSLWEKQIERDSKSGRLDVLTEKADREIDAGRFRKL
jgi:hypothetical protein